MTKNNDNLLAMLSHVLGIFTWFVGPLIIYLVADKSSKTVTENARHSLNFQISLTIYYIVATLLLFGLFGILYFAIYVFSIIVMIIATLKAGNGEVYKYPLEIQFLK